MDLTGFPTISHKISSDWVRGGSRKGREMSCNVPAFGTSASVEAGSAQLWMAWVSGDVWEGWPSREGEVDVSKTRVVSQLKDGEVA